jgi:hypothetical protein
MVPYSVLQVEEVGAFAVNLAVFGLFVRYAEALCPGLAGICRGVLLGSLIVGLIYDVKRHDFVTKID